jgi:predicted nucleic acid-binding protein
VRTYFDTSALAKRYVRERGTEVVLEKCSEATEIVVSAICLPELVSALNRLRRQGLITPGQYAFLKQGAIADFRQAMFVEVSPTVLQEAVLCLESAPLRAMDAIHIATARRAACDTFVSADARQCEAARQLGLPVFQVERD